MSRVKVVAVAFFAALALSVVATDSASAASQWFVGGAALSGGKALSTTAKVDTAAVLNIPKLKIKLTCLGPLLNATSPEIVATNTAKAKSLIFEGCKTLEPAIGCELEENPQRIPTEPVTATATKAASPADRLLVKPQTKALFTSIKFKEKNICALEGKESISGVVSINAPTGQSELQDQPIEGLGSFENNSLEIGGAKAYIEGGRELLLLATKELWSFH